MVLKRCAFSIIFVESGHEPAIVWRRSKLKNKIWHSGHNKLKFPCDHPNQLDILRGVIMLISLDNDLFAGYKKWDQTPANKTKLSNGLKNSTFYWELYLFKIFTCFMESSDCGGCGYCSPNFFPEMPGQRIESIEVLACRSRLLWSITA